MLTNIILLGGQRPPNYLVQDFLVYPKDLVQDFIIFPKYLLPFAGILKNFTIEEILTGPLLNDLSQKSTYELVDKFKDHKFLDLLNIISVGFNNAISLFPYSYLSQVDYIYVLKTIALWLIFFEVCYISYKTYMFFSTLYINVTTNLMGLINILANPLGPAINYIKIFHQIF